MQHSEEISVYKYTKVANDYGGYSDGVAELQTDAPTWATIEVISGNDLLISDRKETQTRLRIIVNWRDDFTWSPDMYVVSRFGNSDIDSIRETKYKSEVTLEGVLIG